MKADFSSLSGLGIEIFGVCRFCDILPLLEVRSKNRLPQNACSVITFLFPYNIGYEGKRNLSLYCLGLDYHDIIVKRLKEAEDKLRSMFPENVFEGFCDISPIREVRAAYLSGLGVLGENGLIINQKYGSYCFIGEIVTDLEFESYSRPIGHCVSCGRCVNSCPGGALSKGGFDAALCLSCITQKKGELSEKEQEMIRNGSLVWGCDACSECCPMNTGAEKSNISEFYQNLLPVLDAENIKASRDRAYGYKGKSILLRNLGIIANKKEQNNIN
jgi:epoxyqueuosine reductase QueG